MVSREVSATPTEKSVKIPNPPVLTDGKDASEIRSKLKANTDHYNIDALRIAYVENRTGGKAAKHLRPRLRVNAVNIHYCGGDAEASRSNLPGSK